MYDIKGLIWDFYAPGWWSTLYKFFIRSEADNTTYTLLYHTEICHYWGDSFRPSNSLSFYGELEDKDEEWGTEKSLFEQKGKVHKNRDILPEKSCSFTRVTFKFQRLAGAVLDVPKFEMEDFILTNIGDYWIQGDLVGPLDLSTSKNLKMAWYVAVKNIADFEEDKLKFKTTLDSYENLSDDSIPRLAEILKGNYRKEK